MALDFKGVDLTSPINRIPSGRVSIAQNIRRYFSGGVSLRTLLTDVILTLAAAVHSIRRLNDSTPNGPGSGYTIISGAGTVLYNNSTPIATGLTGNPVALIPFRPDASVQPWMYQADAAAQGSVTLATKYLINGDAVNFVTNGMNKVRSDGLIYKMGIKEPQLAPVVSTSNSSIPFGGIGGLLATAIPWTNYLSANSDFNYGETEGFPNVTPPVDGTAPFIVNCLNATSILITGLSLDGTVVINGATNPTLTATSSGRVTPGAPGFPGQFIQIIGSGSHPSTASYVVGTFTDGDGNVVPAGVAPLFIPNVVDVGLAFSTSTPIPVPYGAVAFQIGINSEGNTFTQGGSPNSGLITLTGEVTTNALPTVLSILGTLALSYFGDSPSSGPVAEYIWKNPDDPSGSGPTRSTSNANGSTSGNSFIFDATFTAGLPVLPGVGMDTLPMQWTALNPDSVAIGSTPVFPAPLTTTYPNQTIYANFNFCLSGSIYVPAAGDYTFKLTSMDDCIWGIGGGAKVISVTSTGPGGDGSHGLSQSGQTITVVGGYPLLPRGNVTAGEGGDYVQSTVVVNFPGAGIYPIELDYDYWFHSGRILLLDASPTPGAGATIIPPLPANVRQQVQYRYVYRSTATGATSNPSPESAAETVPVNANTITSIWSPDPQVDVVDYYRIDSVTDDFTYVNTGPNDNAGSGTNTPVSDSLLDTDLGTQLLNEDNFEPVPSIDLPQKGICNVSGGVITWVSGGAIGGTATGFNIRWGAGTEILIGSPTSLAYTLIARPTSNTSMTIPGVPDGTGLAYQIAEPQLLAQPLQHMMGPTDNILFAFAWKDPLRPGTLYWCNGNNLDAWADTNQVDITDPSDALVGGDIAGAMGAISSVTKWWIIVPNFFNALANVTGVEGSTWTFQKTAIKRGLFMEWCVSVEGNLIFFRGADGVYLSNRGSEEKSITDDSLYPIFAHEGSTPVSVVRQGVTVYPPDDTQPQLQRFKVIKGYMYYDYQGIDGNPHTLVFDILAMGWVFDVLNPAATCHAANDGVSVQGVIAGCADSTIREMSSAGTEDATAIVMSGAIGGKGYMHTGMMVLEYSSTEPITLNLLPADVNNGSYGPATITLPAQASLAKYWLRPGPNKYKLMTYKFSTTGPFNLNFDGSCAYVADWGGEGYRPVQLFSDSGGGG